MTVCEILLHITDGQYCGGSRFFGDLEPHSMQDHMTSMNHSLVMEVDG